MSESSAVAGATTEPEPQRTMPDSGLLPTDSPGKVAQRSRPLAGMQPIEADVHESPPWGIATKAIIASTFLILTALVVWRFQFLLMPLTIAVIISYLLHPPIRMLHNRLRIHRTYVVIAVYLTLLLILIGGTVAIGLVAVDQVTRLAVSLPNLVPQLIAQAQAFTNELADVEIVIGPYEFSFQAVSGLIDWGAIADEARSLLQQILGQGTLAIAGAAQATLTSLANGLTIFFVSIYISIEGPRIGQVISDVAHGPGYRKDAERLVIETLRIWNSYLRGQVILAILIFVVVSIALSALQVNNALALGLVSGLLEFLPIIGPIIGSGAAVIVAFFQTPPWGLSPLTYALIVLGVMIVIQQVEGNILVPRMVGDSVNVHPLVVMIGVLMGASLAGLLGAVLAAPVVGTLKLLGVYVWRKMLDQHPFPEAIDIEPTAAYTASAEDAAPDSGAVIDTGHDVRVSASAADLLAHPLTFEPIFKDYIWGGRNLATRLGRALPDGTIAESWEIADHPNGASRIAEGPLAGLTLDAALHRFGEDLVGTNNRAALALGRFPLLIKLLDANDRLSVQVHPDDTYALAHEGDLGKTEMWIVLHAEPGAEVICGFSQAVEREQVAGVLDAVASGGDGVALERLLHRIPVQSGDVVYVPAGTIHALGAGLVVAEIQQNSDTTYRLYDWGRPREIHVEKGLDVLDFECVRPGLVVPESVVGAITPFLTRETTLDIVDTDIEETGVEETGVKVERIGHSPYFTVERITLQPGSGIESVTRPDSFEIYGVLQGEAVLSYGAAEGAGEIVLSSVGWALLPAVMGGYRLTAGDPNDAPGNDAPDNRAAEPLIAIRICTPGPQSLADDSLPANG